jgi:proline dehydrogenase
MKKALSKAAWSAWTAAAKFFGKRYVAGPELEDALRVSRRLAGLGFASTICFWNVDGELPRKIADAYETALAALAKEKLDCYLSVKFPPLKFDKALVAEVVERARPNNVLVHFDSLEMEAADQTFAAIEEISASYSRLGCTLPGRWVRSINDAQRAAGLGLHVRVVKGQWDDPAYTKTDLSEGYLDVIEKLAGRARHVAVATHDPIVGRAAIERLRKAGTPCTLELLYGLPVKPALDIARELRVPVRVYVPYGQGWLPYSLTQARKNPRILWWVLRDFVTGGGGTDFGKAPVPAVPESNRSENPSLIPGQ